EVNGELVVDRVDGVEDGGLKDGQGAAGLRRRRFEGADSVEGRVVPVHNDVGRARGLATGEHAEGRTGAEGADALQRRVIDTAERLETRPAVGAGGGDDVGLAVAVHVARGDAHAAGEGRA